VSPIRDTFLSFPFKLAGGHSDLVTKETISVRVTPALKKEFARALKKQPDLSTITDFFESAMAALVMQTRRGETLAFPLEFLSNKSSDKGQESGGQSMT